MAIKDHWNRMVRKSASYASSDESGSSGTFLSKMLPRRTGKSSSSTNASVSDRSDRALSSSGSGTIAGNANKDQSFSSKKCNHLPVLQDDGVNWENMTEPQRHQAQLNAYTIKFGASQPWRRSLDEISPCNSRRASLDMDSF